MNAALRNTPLDETAARVLNEALAI